MSLYFHKVAIIGVGLIGGSLGLVLREKGVANHIIGIGRGVGNLKIAKAMGIINEYTTEVEKGVEDADMVILATPVCATLHLAERIKNHLRKGALVIDVGSVKKEIVSKIDEILSADVYFVGTHPIAGTENAGAEAAFSTLFHGRKCIITPTKRTDKHALEKVETLWRTAGSQVVFMDPERHDMICAAISHLPHVVAYTLVNTIGGVEEDVLRYSAGGFKDFTRIALSPPEMWRDICLLNKRPILHMIELYEKKLKQIKLMIERGDGDGLMGEFEKARGVKEKLRIEN